MLVWVVLLAVVVLPRVDPPAHQADSVAVTQLNAFDRDSLTRQAHEQRTQALQQAQVDSWTQELKDGLAQYQAKQAALAQAKAIAAQIAARSNHPAPPPAIAQDITDAFTPLGARALEWAMNVAWCESRYHPNSVNSSSGASGLFQFLPSTWAFTPYAKYSPFDPKWNALAAAWLYSRDGPSQWECQG